MAMMDLVYECENWRELEVYSRGRGNNTFRGGLTDLKSECRDVSCCLFNGRGRKSLSAR